MIWALKKTKINQSKHRGSILETDILRTPAGFQKTVMNRFFFIRYPPLGTSSTYRFCLLVGLVPCYPACRLLPAFVNRGSPRPLPPLSPFRHIDTQFLSTFVSSTEDTITKNTKNKKNKCVTKGRSQRGLLFSVFPKFRKFSVLKGRNFGKILEEKMANTLVKINPKTKNKSYKLLLLT